MHPLAKVFLGIILIIGSVWWILSGSERLLNGRSALADLLTVANGVIPVLVFILGIFIVWLELDELKIEKELKAEERKSRKR